MTSAQTIERINRSGMLGIRCNLMGVNTDEIRPRLGYWWVCCGVRLIMNDDRTAIYTFERGGGVNGRIEITAKHNKVASVKGYNRIITN